MNQPPAETGRPPIEWNHLAAPDPRRHFRQFHRTRIARRVVKGDASQLYPVSNNALASRAEMKTSAKLASLPGQSKTNLVFRVRNRHLISRDPRPPLIAASINRQLAPHQRTKRLLATPKPD